ncbi:MAG: fasciclin domain-containing protein [Rhodospirillales bacterium]|nr:fasciclin domain-containing protein [Rhodospirillales bacterium]
MTSLSRRTLFAAGGMAAASAAVLGKAGFAAGADPAMSVLHMPYEDAYAVFLNDPRFGIWFQLLQQSGLAPYAHGTLPVTLFVPTNTAFRGHPGILSQVLPAGSEAFPNTTLMIALVRAHVVRGLYPPAALSGKKTTLTTVSHQKIEVDGTVVPFVVTWQSIRGEPAHATVEQQALQTSNALIYPFDKGTFGTPKP